MPALKATMEHLKSQGVKEFGAVGYCFGARYVFNLSYDGLIKVGAVNHPSLIQPEDIEKIGKTGVPILFNVRIIAGFASFDISSIVDTCHAP